jgi:hypothetical protein
MAGRIRDNQEIPRPDSVERDTFVREIARTLLEALGNIDKDMIPKSEQFLGGIVHYLLGRVHDRPDLPRVQAGWRGKAPLVSLMRGLLVRQRETMGTSSEALGRWLEGLVKECEAGKFNPLTIRAFTAMSKSQSRQTAPILDLAERSLRVEMGLTG